MKKLMKVLTIFFILGGIIFSIDEYLFSSVPTMSSSIRLNNSKISISDHPFSIGDYEIEYLSSKLINKNLTLHLLIKNMSKENLPSLSVNNFALKNIKSNEIYVSNINFNDLCDLNGVIINNGIDNINIIKNSNNIIVKNNKDGSYVTLNRIGSDSISFNSNKNDLATLLMINNISVNSGLLELASKKPILKPNKIYKENLHFNLDFPINISDLNLLIYTSNIILEIPLKCN